VDHAHHGDATAADAENGSVWFTTDPTDNLDDAAAAEYERGFQDGWTKYLNTQH